MNTTSVEIGDRYDDDSGWERRVVADKHSDRVTIEIQSHGMSFELSEALWVVEALSKAVLTIDPMARGYLGSQK